MKCHPFNKIVEGMIQPEMILETVEIIKRAVDQGMTIYVIVNNRAGGNAPLIAEMITEKFLVKPEPPAPTGQLRLW